MHTLQVCILLTVYHIQLFKQMTQITAGRICEKNNFGSTDLSVFHGVCLCLCLCSNDERRKYCGRSCTDGEYCFQVLGSNSVMNKTAR